MSAWTKDQITREVRELIAAAKGHDAARKDAELQTFREGSTPDKVSLIRSHIEKAEDLIDTAHKLMDGVDPAELGYTR